MKFVRKKNKNITLSEKIADALTLKPRADIEDDQVFDTKPHTVSRADFSSSDSEDETAISDFRKQNVNLLSEVSKKYEGQVVSRKDLEEASVDNTSDNESEKDQINLNSFEEVSSGDNDDIKKVKNFKQLTRLDDSDSSSESVQLKKKDTPSRHEVKNNADLEQSSDSNGESDDYDITQFKKQLDNDDDKSEDSANPNEDDSDVDEGEGYDISQLEEPLKEDFKHVKKQNLSEEARKGSCVRNQLLIWEGLLEMRIHLQRCLNTANQMPMPDTHKELMLNSEFTEECKTTKSNLSSVLEKFLSLQSMLLKRFPDTKTLSVKQKENEIEEPNKEGSDEEIPSDTDNEEIPSDTEDEDVVPEKKQNKDEKPVCKKRKLEDYEKEISTSYKIFRPFRDTTIQKWNDKTRLTTAANVKNTPTNTILQQVAYILSDREKLLRRTQLKRAEYEIVGYKKPEAEDNQDKNVNGDTVMKDRKDNDEYIPEIFDDSDFYHQLLRELIECKSADISDPVQLSRQWIALQQMRSKMKRKVDTKATKGRKIKYVVHKQLVNYMASEKSTTWDDESTNELYSSLFGKMFEQNNVGVNDNLSNVFKLKN